MVLVWMGEFQAALCAEGEGGEAGGADVRQGTDAIFNLMEERVLIRLARDVA